MALNSDNPKPISSSEGLLSQLGSASQMNQGYVVNEYQTRYIQNLQQRVRIPAGEVVTSFVGAIITPYGGAPYSLSPTAYWVQRQMLVPAIARGAAPSSPQAYSKITLTNDTSADFGYFVAATNLAEQAAGTTSLVQDGSVMVQVTGVRCQDGSGLILYYFNQLPADKEFDAMLTSPVVNEGGDSTGLYNFTSAIITSTTDPADGNIPQWRLLTSEEPGYVTGVAYYMNDPGFKYDPPSSFSPGNPVGYFPYDSSGGGVPGSIIARLRWDYDKATPPHKIYRILSVGCAQRYRIGHTEWEDNGAYCDQDAPNQGNGYRVLILGENSSLRGRKSARVEPVPGGGSGVDGSYLAVGPATVALVNAVVGGATKITGDNWSVQTYSNAAAWIAGGAGTGPTPSDAATVPTGVHASNDL